MDQVFLTFSGAYHSQHTLQDRIPAGDNISRCDWDLIVRGYALSQILPTRSNEERVSDNSGQLCSWQLKGKRVAVLSACSTCLFSDEHSKALVFDTGGE